MRQLRQALQAVPQLVLVQPEQLGYDLAFALALLPPVLCGLIFFRQDAVLVFAVSLLAGIVCLLALQLGRLTLGLPAWVGHKANHPLVASVLITCLMSPRTALWLCASAVMLFVVMDTFVWPQLRRVMLHPALIVLGLLFIAQRQLGETFVNPFDGRQQYDPLTLWYHFRTVVNPVTLYVGNVAGPVGATSAGAVLLGLVYLWYARKVSLGIVFGFLVGLAIPALLIGPDAAFQLSSGPGLFLVGYIAADRRRVLLSEPFLFIFGLAAGAATMILRGYGQGQEATWESLLVVSTLVTVYLRLRAFLSGTSDGAAERRPLRAFSVASGRDTGVTARAQRSPVRQAAMAMAPAGAGFQRHSSAVGFDAPADSDDLVRRMRYAASRGPLQTGRSSLVIRALSLILLNPLGLLLTWSSTSVSLRDKRLVTALSTLWYLAAAGLALALTHLR